MKKYFLLSCSLLCLMTGVAQAQFKDLHDFNGTDGLNPGGDVTLSGHKLYGMSFKGGAYSYGLVFSIDTNGANYTDLLDFNGTNGQYPQDNSFILSGNTLYGTTEEGGINGTGNIFSVDTMGGNYTDLHDFGIFPTYGIWPYGVLTLSANKFYGMTMAGGNWDGDIYSMSTNGNNYKVLHNFNDTNGYRPLGSLTLSGKTLFGMTQQGGSSDSGVIFSIDTDGSNFKVLLNFNNANGGNPDGTLTLLGHTLYGMASVGGAHGVGLVFSIDTDGSNYTHLFDFSGGVNGEDPLGSLTLSGNTLYGATSTGGVHNDGNIFCIETNGNNYKDLFDFNGTNGYWPMGDLTLFRSHLYGMTYKGGIYSDGNIFSVYVPLTAGPDKIGISCNGNNDGKAIGYAFGGATPYTYKWSPGGSTNDTITGLSLGTYSVTITDSLGVTVSTSVTITQPMVLTATVGTLDNVLCNGGKGSAKATVSGGTSSYKYAWSPSGGVRDTGTGLTAGFYTVSVTDAHGCKATASVTITQPPLLTATMGTPANIQCNGGTGSATVTADGGISPYTYLWAPSGGNNASATGLKAGSYKITVTDYNGCSATAGVTITQPTLLTAAMGIPTNILCNGGTSSVTVTTGGGISPYTYLWSPSGGTNAMGTGLTAGLYMVTITDLNDCSVTAGITITQPTIVTSTNGAQTNILCNGGTSSLTVTAGGGVSPYTYLWTPSGGSNATGTGLTAGLYRVMIKDNNSCATIDSVTITQPAILAATVGAPNHVLCNGGTGSATVSASGGTSPYVYSWAPSGGTNATGTGLTAGSYKVTITDLNGCTATANATITQPAILTATMGAPNNPLCNGGTGSATISASGGTTPYVYSWAPSGGSNAMGTGLTAGAYIVTIRDNYGCSATASVTITQPTAMVVIKDSVNVDGAGGCNGEASVNVSGGTAPYFYQWSPGGGTNDTINAKCAGQYCCTVTDNNGCKQNVCITILNTTGINELGGESETVKVYPNPSNGVFQLEITNYKSGINNEIEVYNVLGEEVYTETLRSPQGDNSIDLRNESNGIYLYRVITETGNLIGEGKLIIQK